MRPGAAGALTYCWALRAGVATTSRWLSICKRARISGAYWPRFRKHPAPPVAHRTLFRNPSPREEPRAPSEKNLHPPPARRAPSPEPPSPSRNAPAIRTRAGRDFSGGVAASVALPFSPSASTCSRFFRGHCVDGGSTMSVVLRAGRPRQTPRGERGASDQRGVRHGFSR